MNWTTILVSSAVCSWEIKLITTKKRNGKYMPSSWNSWEGLNRFQATRGVCQYINTIFMLPNPMWQWYPASFSSCGWNTRRDNEVHSQEWIPHVYQELSALPAWSLLPIKWKWSCSYAFASRLHFPNRQLATSLDTRKTDCYHGNLHWQGF